jgi:hypothetical protein
MLIFAGVSLPNGADPIMLSLFGHHVSKSDDTIEVALRQIGHELSKMGNLHLMDWFPPPLLCFEYLKWAG